MSKKRIVGFSVLGLAVLVVLVAVINSGGSSGPGPSQSGPTPTPEPVVVVAAETLHAEREANATRFDDKYKGTWVQVSGIVEGVDSGDVTLAGGSLLENVVLQDLPRDVQGSVDKGQRFEAVCRMGNFILFSIYMEDCRLP